MYIILSFLLGFVSGLRSMTPLAAVSWVARLGLLDVSGTPLAFMGYQATPLIFTLLALGELVADKLPNTPSRKAPLGFIGRIVSGGLVGATVGAARGSLIAMMIVGVLGAIAGTFGGAALRGRLATAFGKDLPAALLEDAFAIGMAIVLVTRL